MATAGEEEFPLQVVSIDPQPGLIRVRVVAPTPSSSFGDGDLTIAVDGREVSGEVQPVDVASLGVSLVVDTSQSMSGPAIDAAKVAAVDFTRALPEEAPVSVIGFGDRAEVKLPSSTDREAAVEALGTLEATGETSLYDGIVTALTERGERGDADRQVLVVLSDGGDTASETTLEQAKAALDGSGVEFVAIALATDESNAEVLGQLADTVGGSVVSTDDPAALREIYTDLATGLSSEYEVAIEVGDQPWVTIALDVLDPETGRVHGWRERVTLSGTTDPVTTATEQPAPATVFVPQTSALAGPVVLWAGAAMTVVAVAAIGFSVLGMRSGESRRSGDRLGGPNDSHIRAFRDLRSGASLVVEGVLVDSDTRADLAARLEQGGLRLRTGEFVIATVALLVAGAVAGSLVWSLWIGGLTGALGAALPRLVLQFAIGRRRRAFAGQLPDLLSALSNTLRVGYSLPQAINSVADDAPEPAQSELKRALLEARVGGDIVESLRTVADRTGSRDLEWVVDAVEINATVGGDLVDVLERVAETIRSRTRMKAQVNALTAEARMSALVLFLLPPGLGLVILLLNPAYFEGIWDGPGGYLLIGVGSTLLGAGGAWLRRMISAVAP